MPLTTTWSVRFGNPTTSTNFTSRVLKMDINQRAPVGQFGVGSATITMENNDGAFTPRGGGIYSSTDWFTQGVFIEVITPLSSSTITSAVFHGFVTEFQLEDNGLYSTVTFTCQDCMSMLAKNSSLPFTTAAAGLLTVSDAFLLFYNGNLSYWNITTPTVSYPNIGLSFFTLRVADADRGSAAMSGYYAGQERYTYSNGIAISSTSTMDIINTFLMPMNMTVAWSGPISQVGAYAVYTAFRISGLARNTLPSYSSTFVFKDIRSIDSTSFPFDDIQIGYNIPDVINEASIGRATSGTTPQKFSNSTQVGLYGNRSVSNSNVALQSDAVALSLATEYATRYSIARFAPKQITFSAKQIERYTTQNSTTEELLYKLYSIEWGMWNRANITWTGKGVGSQTYSTKIRGRQFSITPTDTVVTLDLVPSVDNSTFIIGVDKVVNSASEEQLGVRTIA